MDPLTQGALGASLPQAASSKSNVILAGILGFLSGMAPDLDVFIRSNTDPLLFLEYHRQFTHSLFFIPIGGFICACVFYLLITIHSSLSFKQTYIFCTLGYATHGLLDTCTSYGTQLLWPFTNHRYSWDTISIIDPILTIPLIILILTAAVKKQPRYALAGLLWVVCYLFFGLYQNHRANDIGWEIANERGHMPVRLEAKPSFANLILWKIIYETEDGFYTDGVKIGFNTKKYLGTFTPKLNIADDMPWLNADSQQAKDLKRFTWFSQGYVSIDANNPLRVIDVRYSLLPNEAKGLWSIWLSPNATDDQHVEYRTDRQINSQQREQFINMLFDN